MATDQADKARQQRLPGTIDEPTQAVLAKAEAYVELLYGRMRQQEAENTARDELIELMRADDIREFALDGYEIKLKHTEKDKIAVKKTGEDDGD